MDPVDYQTLLPEKNSRVQPEIEPGTTWMAIRRTNHYTKQAVASMITIRYFTYKEPAPVFNVYSLPEVKESSIQKVNNVCAYSLRTCFFAADHWFPVFNAMLKIASCNCTSDLVTW